MTQGIEALRRIGVQLDRDLYPEVMDGGFVVPAGHAIHPKAGMEIDDERARQRGSSTGSWQGTARREGATGGSGPACATPSTVGGGLEAHYAKQIDELSGAYPSLRVWAQPGGFWLRVTAGLIRGLKHEAILVGAVPFNGQLPRFWGFWQDGSWIGPRHTNFNDGSICGLFILDQTWCVGEPLLPLLDIYTLWAVRQLHVRLVGRWPGRQVAIYRHERLTEIGDDELCGCGSSKRYAACCKPDDVKWNRLYTEIQFLRQTAGGERSPPVAVIELMTGSGVPPAIN